jgi:hypothetical protein
VQQTVSLKHGTSIGGGIANAVDGFVHFLDDRKKEYAILESTQVIAKVYSAPEKMRTILQDYFKRHGVDISVMKDCVAQLVVRRDSQGKHKDNANVLDMVSLKLVPGDLGGSLRYCESGQGESSQWEEISTSYWWDQASNVEHQGFAEKNGFRATLILRRYLKWPLIELSRQPLLRTRLNFNAAASKLFWESFNPPAYDDCTVIVKDLVGKMNTFQEVKRDPGCVPVVSFVQPDMLAKIFAGQRSGQPIKDNSFLIGMNRCGAMSLLQLHPSRSAFHHRKEVGMLSIKAAKPVSFWEICPRCYPGHVIVGPVHNNMYCIDCKFFFYLLANEQQDKSEKEKEKKKSDEEKKRDKEQRKKMLTERVAETKKNGKICALYRPDGSNVQYNIVDNDTMEIYTHQELESFLIFKIN